ncbi:hypothetical protein [Thauera sp. Sel9]|uniref:hypothetical protein n=1 Tax=Thauera sp. Sel9 TaxID=2974299 RepID=UPI0021E123E6|nr:hypothetical protein [Thauera sp. Sel9]MCV2216604.1 hypothetical protein [Thauera sp. Sel9]
MIIVIEGVSAAGKTTWASRYAPAVVDEITTTPPTEDDASVAQYWSDEDSERWRRGLELERIHDIVCFDTDPLKIHYAWCLWQIGSGSRETWMANVQTTRKRISEKQLGFADQIVFLDPPEQTIRLQRTNDKTRLRRSFETHIRLYEPLRRWYLQLETLSPGSVLFNAHQAQDWTPARLRADRYDLGLFDALIDATDRRDW